jgi:hypothetical protein
VRTILPVRGVLSQHTDRFSSVTGGGFEPKVCAKCCLTEECSR